MNPNTPPPSDDLPDERELAALYARLPKIEPDAALDAAVLAKATRALPVRRRPRWPVALGSAAVLVLAVGVAWQVRDTRPDVTATLPAPSARYAPAPAVERQVDAGTPAKPQPPLQEQIAPQLLPRVRTETVTAIPLTAPGAAPAPAPAPAVAPPLQREPEASGTPQADNRAGGYLPKLDFGPDDRVGEIRRLLDRGQREEALRSLRDLRERYPHYELPQDLRDLKP
jgi:Meckel syndrome type 1 protein